MNLFSLCSLALITAAPEYEVQRSDGTKLTYESLSDQYKNDARTLRSFPVRVASEGFLPLRQPGARQPSSGAPALKFLEQVLLIGEHKEDYYQKDRDDEHYFLIGSPGANGQNPILLGWVPAARVLTKNSCMTDPRSGIRIKGMPINSLGYLKKSGLAVDPSQLRAPQIRLAPTPDGEPDGAFRFFDFYHVLADTNPGPENDNVGYALLGDLAEWNGKREETQQEFRGTAKIIGWVDKTRLCLWRTREAVQWDDLRWPDVNGQFRTRTEPGVAYPTIEHALLAANLPTSPPKDAGPVVSEVFAEGKPVDWDSKRMRYPLLTMRVNGEEVSSQTHGKKQLYRVGVIGDVYDAQGTPLMRERDRQAINLEIRQIEQELNRTEILFVIDRTVSMREWWPNISRVVGRLRDKVVSEGRTVAIGFCYYGDVYPGTEREGKVKDLAEAVKLGGVLPGRLVELNTEGATFDQQLRDLADKSRMIEGGYRPEMVYAGLEVGLREAKWGGSTESGKFARKMVILIGDDGNHKIESKEEEEKIQERIANLCVFGRSEPPPAELAKQLYETPKEFYALQMNPVSNESVDPSYQFRSQTKSLVARIKAKSNELRAEYFHISDEKALYTTIDARYADLVAKVSVMKQELQRVRTGQITTAIRDPEVAAMVQAIAAKHNIKIEELTGGTQAFDIRYIWSHGPRTGEPLVRKMILAADGEIDPLIARLRSLFHDQQNPPSLEDIAINLIALQSGDELSIDQVRKLDAKDKDTRLALLKKQRAFSFLGPFQTFIRPMTSGSSNPTADDLEAMKIKQRLEKRLYLFEDIRAERISTYKKKSTFDMVGLEKVGEPRKLFGDKKRGFSRGEDTQAGKSASLDKQVRWYWLDFEEEWP